jgi:excisionase family DNA binding protein
MQRECKMDLPEALLRLDQIETTLLAQIQELRIIRAEFQKHVGNGALEPLLDAEEVAELLGVEVDHIHAQARAGKIPSVKVGKYRKFSPSQLKKWLDRKNAS